MNWSSISDYTAVDFAVMAALLVASIGLVVAIVNGIRQLRGRSDRGPGAA